MQRRSRETVEAILEAAAQVLEAQGYAAASTNHIAARAGVAIGTLYQYFPSKESLAVALLERHLADSMGRLREWVARASAGPPDLRATLTLFVEGMLALHGARPRLQHVLLEETPLPPRVHETWLQAEREATQLVVALLGRHPAVRHPDLPRAAAMAVQVVETLVHRVLVHPEQGLSRDAFATELVFLLEAYLTRG